MIEKELAAANRMGAMMEKELRILRQYVWSLEAQVGRLERDLEKGKDKGTPFPFTKNPYIPPPVASTSQPPKRKLEEGFVPLAKENKKPKVNNQPAKKGSQPMIKKDLIIQAEKQGLILMAKVDM